MAEVNIKRFVDINIQPHVEHVVSGTRDTVVLYTNEGSNTGRQVLIDSYTKAKQYYDTTYTGDRGGISVFSCPTTLSYLKVFFDNGGAKVLVIENTALSNITTDTLKALDNKYICILYADVDNNVLTTYSAFETLATSMASDSTVYGVNEKLLIARTNTTTNTSSITFSKQTRNFIVKYSSVLGAEMTIAAYLSKINCYGVDTVCDYAFTQEVLIAENLADADFGTIMTDNMNVDINLSNTTRNCGGNCKDGLDITNNFVRIVLHQTLSESLLNLLVQKIKNSTGISKMYAVIVNELDKYLTSGYLTTDKIWNEEDLVIHYGDTDYTIIEKGTALTNGYIIKVLPLSSLTANDKAKKAAPPVYVVIADQYGIRLITVNGEVI